MNWAMAKEVGPVRYVLRRLAWRMRTRNCAERIPYVLPGGQRIMLPPRSPFAADIYCTRGLVDWGSEQLLLEFLRQQKTKGCCYDVGGNMGYYSVLLASVVERVFAFEPDARNHSDLLAQDISGLTLVRKAVSDRCGTARFDASSASTVGHLSEDKTGAGHVEVETVTLDEFRHSRPLGERVAGVKVDIEGYEISCLHGAEQLAAHDRPVFLIEFAIEAGRPNSFPALGEFTARHRYEIFAMIRHRRGRTAFRTMLEKTTAAALPSQDHKMIFLAPEEISFFKEQCEAGFCFEKMQPPFFSNS
jgi:FkbM family methyltransferase